MINIKHFRGYDIYKTTPGAKRLYIAGKGVSCLKYFYNINNAMNFINYTIKYTIPALKEINSYKYQTVDKTEFNAYSIVFNPITKKYDLKYYESSIYNTLYSNVSRNEVEFYFMKKYFTHYAPQYAAINDYTDYKIYYDYDFNVSINYVMLITKKDK